MPLTSPSPATTSSRWTLIVLSAATFMASLDLFIVNVAFPSISEAFHGTSASSLSWVLNAYTIVLAALPIPLGRLADAYGRRLGFVVGIVIFGVASALCAVAPSIEFLIAARTVQAVGASLLLPTSLSLVLGAFGPDKRQGAVAIWAATGTLAAASGPPLGGLLTELSWRWIFLVNVPLAALTLVGAFRYIPEVKTMMERRLPDVVGSAFLIAGLALSSLGLVEGNTWAWASWKTIGAIVVAVLLIGGFLFRSDRHAVPVLDLKLFEQRSFSVASGVTILFFTGFGAMLLNNVLFLTDIWHRSSIVAGLEFAAAPVVATVTSFGFSQRLGARIGHRPMAMIGAGLFSAGSILMIVLAGSHVDYVADYLPGAVVTGLGSGLIIPTLPALLSGSLPPEQRATGSAVFAMSRQLGTVLGVSGLVAIIASHGVHETASIFHRGWAFIAAAEAAAVLASILIPRRGAAGEVSAGVPSPLAEETALAA